jgi:hypothetical protein
MRRRRFRAAFFLGRIWQECEGQAFQIWAEFPVHRGIRPADCLLAEGRSILRIVAERAALAR